MLGTASHQMNAVDRVFFEDYRWNALGIRDKVRSVFEWVCSVPEKELAKYL